MPQEYTHYGTLRGFVSLEMADFNKSIFAQTAHTEASSRSVLQYLFIVSAFALSSDRCVKLFIRSGSNIADDIV